MAVRSAFTLVELIVVIAITAILTTFTADISLNLYKSYIQSRAVNRLETKTQLILEQLSKLLSIRVSNSVIARSSNSGDFVSIKDNNSYKILEWISYSYESFLAGGYSGFADLGSPNTVKNSSTGSIYTPLSDLEIANLTISDLTNKDSTLRNATVGIIFKGIDTDIKTSFGYDFSTNEARNIGIAKIVGKDILELSDYASNQISERYDLLHTAYAVVPSHPSERGDFELSLHYNYRPWLKSGKNNYKKSDVATLAKNVIFFKSMGMDDTVVIKICLRDYDSSFLNKNEGVTVCKTKAID